MISFEYVLILTNMANINSVSISELTDPIVEHVNNQYIVVFMNYKCSIVNFITEAVKVYTIYSYLWLYNAR